MAILPKTAVELRRTGRFESAARTALLLSAALFLVILSGSILRLYPRVSGVVLKANALLDEGARLEIDGKKLIKDTDTAETAQTAALRVWNGKISAALDNANGELYSLRRTTDHLTADEDMLTAAGVQSLGGVDKTTEALAGDATALQGALKQLGDAAGQLSSVAADPDIRRTLKASADFSEQGAGIATDAHKVTTHLEQKIDHPAPMTTFQKLKAGWGILWQLAMLAK